MHYIELGFADLTPFNTGFEVYSVAVVHHNSENRSNDTADRPTL